MMIDDLVSLGTLPDLNICSQPLPLTIWRPASLYGIILVCMIHACLVVNCQPSELVPKHQPALVSPGSLDPPNSSNGRLRAVAALDTIYQFQGVHTVL